MSKDKMNELQIANDFQAIMPQKKLGRNDEFESKKRAKTKYTQNGLLKEQIKEQEQRRALRWVALVFFSIILLTQHAMLALFVWAITSANKITELETLLSIIIPGTLGETYIVIRTMVKFIFSPGNFEKRTQNNAR